MQKVTLRSHDWGAGPEVCVPDIDKFDPKKTKKYFVAQNFFHE